MSLSILPSSYSNVDAILCFRAIKVKETSLQLRVSTTFLLQMVTPLLLTLANIIEAAWFTFDPAYLIVSWQYLTSWCMIH